MLRAGMREGVKRYSEQVGGGGPPLKVGIGNSVSTSGSFTINGLEAGDTILFVFARTAAVMDYVPLGLTLVASYSTTLAVYRYNVPTGETSKTFSYPSTAVTSAGYVVLKNAGEIISKGPGGSDSNAGTVTLADQFDIADTSYAIAAFYSAVPNQQYSGSTNIPNCAWRSAAGNKMMVSCWPGPMKGLLTNMSGSVPSRHIMLEVKAK